MEGIGPHPRYRGLSPLDGWAKNRLDLSAQVVSFHTVKPLDEHFPRDALSRFRLVATIEEHSLIGGFGAAGCSRLDAASEACFSLRAYIATIDRRVAWNAQFITAHLHG